MSIRTLSRLVLVLALAALPACDAAEPSEHVRQDRIHTDFELGYDADQDVTTARASFRFGGPNGTQLELSGSSEAAFSGQPLARKHDRLLNRTYYERTMAGYVAEGTFRFRDTDGRTYLNSVTLRPIAFPAGVGPIDNDAAYELRWNGAALAENEEVRVALYRLTGGTSLALFSQDDEGSQTIILDRAQLSNVQPGSVTLRMDRTLVRDLADATAVGGRMTARYSPRDVSVQVVD